MSSNYEQVSQFVNSALRPVADKPTKMSYESVLFLLRMVFSEFDELACTVTNDNKEKEDLLLTAFYSRDKCENYVYKNDISIIAAQADALVDAWYYSLNAACKHGVNLSQVFDVVHEANMRKIDPKTGKCRIRESDKKIMKPEGWKSPDIDAEIERQINAPSEAEKMKEIYEYYGVETKCAIPSYQKYY